jgi:hypothetical protein
MPTNPNMVAIQTVTVGSGGAASIDFTSIPQTYTDLYMVLSTRLTGNAGGMYMTFNGSSSSYSGKRLGGQGASTTYSDSNAGLTNKFFLRAEDSRATANTFGSSEVYIPNYTSSNNKSASGNSVAEDNGTTYNGVEMEAMLWSNSAAITQVTIVPEAGNFAQYSTATLYGVTSSAYGAKATGGIITSDANYYYHTFLASGTFTPTSNITADYLVVAGGGGGGYNVAGGGGAGGLRCTVTATGGGGSLESALSLTASTNYTVTVGAGGAGGTSGSQTGTNGSNSVFSTITSTGGGGGGYNDKGSGSTGGSGGGGAGSGTSPAGSGGAGTANQGYAGGAGYVGNPYYPSGGGGGAGAAGQIGQSNTGGAGGAGVATVISGSSVTYAGGGGGASENGGTKGAGGAGGGGTGGQQSVDATAGTVNLGGGGGGGKNTSNGGAGGSGIVIVRYSK